MIEHIKEAIREVFGDLLGDNAEDCIDLSVREGDPYCWSPGAVATISMEHGLPGTEDTWGIEKWQEVSSLLDDFFCSPVNSGVMAVHEE